VRREKEKERQREIQSLDKGGLAEGIRRGL
jgi:hypothetical protein